MIELPIDFTEMLGRQHGTRSPLQHARGFTLIELMVTISIAAILLAVAAPSFRSFVRNAELRTASNDFMVALTRARSEAVKRGWPVTVCKSTNATADNPSCSSLATWEGGWVMFVNFNGDNDGATASVDAASASGGPSADIVLRASSATNTNVPISGGASFSAYITYLPTGTVRGSGSSGAARSGDFSACLPPKSKVISISKTGRNQMTDGTCT
jgi:type IV fimbrial biogenesis protein FimT